MYVVVKYSNGKIDYFTQQVFSEIVSRESLGRVEKITRDLTLDEAEKMLNRIDED